MLARLPRQVKRYSLALVLAAFCLAACRPPAPAPRATLTAPPALTAAPTLTPPPAPSATLRPSSPTPSLGATSRPAAIRTHTPTAPPAATPTAIDPRAALPAGHYLLVVTRDGLVAASLDGLVRVRLSSGIRTLIAALAPDGRTVAFNNDGQLELLDLATGRGWPLGPRSYGLLGLAWSPDGQHIAVAAGEGDEAYSIYVVSVATGERARLTSGAAVERSPAWSPDGQWLAFASDRAKLQSTTSTGASQLYLMDMACLSAPSTCAAHMRALSGPGWAAASDDPAWSPDSGALVFRCGVLEDETYQSDLCAWERAANTVTRLTRTPEDESRPAWSPDGRTLGYTRAGSAAGYLDVYALSALTGETRNVSQTPEMDESFVGWLVVE
jgi:Tol biopolymer transport system component